MLHAICGVHILEFDIRISFAVQVAFWERNFWGGFGKDFQKKKKIQLLNRIIGKFWK